MQITAPFSRGVDALSSNSNTFTSSVPGFAFILKGVRKMRPEILAPVGSVEALNAALAAGCDAVYFGLPMGTT